MTNTNNLYFYSIALQLSQKFTEMCIWNKWKTTEEK